MLRLARGMSTAIGLGMARLLVPRRVGLTKGLVRCDKVTITVATGVVLVVKVAGLTKRLVSCVTVTVVVPIGVRLS